MRGAQETPRAARREPLFSGRNQQQTRVVQQIFGGNSATTARILLLLLFCLTSKAKEAAVQHVLRAAVSYRLGAPARPPSGTTRQLKNGVLLSCHEISWQGPLRFSERRFGFMIEIKMQNILMCRMCDVLYVAG